MGIYQSMAGTVTVKIESADVQKTINRLAMNGIILDGIGFVSSLCITATIHRTDYLRAKKICGKLGDKMTLTERKGVYWRIKTLISRPVIVVSLLLLLICVFYLPSRVLFIRVEGNDSIPTLQILESARQCGIRFGASRRNVRSEKVKNALLEKIPQLQWAGVNTAGCTAVISVEEKSVPEVSEWKYTVSSIVAARDCVIQSATAQKGNLLWGAGQAVKAGQTLISGYTDCGLCIRATRAQGEVIGKTSREIEAIGVYPTAKKGNECKRTKKYAVRIGKKVINLYKDSGISPKTCDKMYVTDYLTLPGGFRLPLGLTVIEEICYEENTPAKEDWQWMADYSRRYISQQMIAGEILSEDVELSPGDNGYTLYGRYACIENVGRERNEGIIK